LAHLEIDGGRISLRCIINKQGVQDEDRMYLSTDRKKWRAFVKAAMNLWGFTNGGEFLDQLHKGNQYAKNPTKCT
jgi:hypothetical protein